MNGKVCLVTGATSGIGEAVATGLVRQGATVVIVGRDRPKCESLTTRLTALNAGRVDFLVANLALVSEVVRLSEDVKHRYDRLDVLVNNAGGIFMRRSETAEGIESTFALNYLAYFMLTNALIDLLQASAPSRVVNVASSGHAMVGGIDFDDIQSRRGYRGMKVYYQSKLAGIVFTYESARRLATAGVTVNAVDPGMVRTNIGRNNGVAWRVLKPLVDIALRLRYVTPEESARGILYLATSKEVAQVTGKYFRNGQQILSSPASYEHTTSEQLSKVSEELTNHAISNISGSC